MKLPRVTNSPKAFAALAAVINKLADILERRLVFTSRDGSITITDTDNGIDLSAAPGQSGAGASFRHYTQALTVAGIIPTATEIATAMVAAYTAASTTPRQGDMVNLTVSGTCKLRAVVTTTGTASGLYVVAFTVSSVTYYAQVVQTGLY